MELIGSQLSGDVGLKVLLSPLSSNIVARTACCAVGIGLPVYSTFKAIEKKDLIAQEKWLVYWAVYGSFTVAELPPNYGAKQLYAKYLKKFLLKHQARIDKFLSMATNEINKFISSHQVEIDFLRAVAFKCAKTAKEIVSDTTPESSINGQNSPDRRLTDGSDPEHDN